MSVSRRNLLSSLSVTALASVFGGLTFAPKAIAAPLTQWLGKRSPFTKDNFAPHQGSYFEAIDASNNRTQLELVEVEESSPDPKYDALSLIFQGKGEENLVQETYRLRHPRLGQMNLLLVPILTKNPNHQYYQAICTRLRHPVFG
ncbi:MAG: hypothetical protein AB4290_29960 [Spirulina sp.]